MNYTYALKLLDLNKNTTLEELQKRYKELIKKYHPDNNLNNQAQATENIKEVINAYMVVKKHLQKNYNLFERKKLSKKRKIIKEYIYEENSNDEFLEKYQLLEKNIVFLTLSRIDESKNNDDLQEIIDNFYECITNNIRNMIEEYIQINAIETKNIKTMLLEIKKSTIIEAYKEVNKIVTEITKEEIKELISKYKNYPYYDKVKKYILNIIHIALEEPYEVNKIGKLDKIILRFFDEYDRTIKNNSVKLQRLLNKLKDYKGINEYKLIEEDIKKASFIIDRKNFIKEYKKINSKIKNIIKSKEIEKLKEKDFFNIFLSEYYNYIYIYYENSTSHDKNRLKEQIYKLFMLSQLFENIDNLELDVIILLKKLETVSFEEVSKLINMILYGKKINYENIFFHRFGLGISEMVLVDDIDKNNISYKEGQNMIRYLDCDTFKFNFISLKKFIKSSKFVGRRMSINDEYFNDTKTYLALLENDSYLLLCNDELSNFLIIDKSIEYELGEKVIKEIDREFIYDKILTFLKNEDAEYKNTSIKCKKYK